MKVVSHCAKIVETMDSSQRGLDSIVEKIFYGRRLDSDLFVRSVYFLKRYSIVKKDSCQIRLADDSSMSGVTKSVGSSPKPVCDSVPSFLSAAAINQTAAKTGDQNNGNQILTVKACHLIVLTARGPNNIFRSVI